MKVLNLYANRKIYFDKKGYALISINGKDTKVHLLEWEKYNGKKPKGFQVHHIDNDKGNWNINNLELVTQSDHFRIHNGWVRKNGEWIEKPCKDCGHTLPLNKFYQRKGLTPSQRCIECSSKYFKKINTLEHKAKRKIYMEKYYKENKAKWENY